jgi:site-specific recombinase XerD
VAEYVADKSTGLGASTVGRDLSVLQAIFTTARREELVEQNAAEKAERPKLPAFRPQILEPAEVARVHKAFTDEQARVVFLTLVRARTAYGGDEERVFCHPQRGTVYRAERFGEALTAALKAAGVAKEPRPFHDLRHTAITNDAAAGSSPIAVMAKAGHANMATTHRYLHLAGVVFRDEAAALERRLLGGAEPGTKLYPSEVTSADLA